MSHVTFQPPNLTTFCRLDAVFADPRHADVWRAWRVYQQVVAGE